jgi:voltage-gated potassium channel Kch
MAQSAASPHVIIAGFGIPGRAVADLLLHRGIPFVVIERNAEVVTRCIRGGVHIHTGDVLDESTLREAGIDRATLLILAIPDDQTAVAAVELAKRLKPSLPIIARCIYTSAGLQATIHGADEVIVAEQVVAREFTRIVGAKFPAS